MNYSADEYWARLGRTVQRQVIGKLLFGLRLHAGPGTVPRVIRVELLRQVLREVENEPGGGAEDGAEEAASGHRGIEAPPGTTQV